MLLLAVLMPCGQRGQRLAAQTQTLMNKPYIDNRRFHWGFYLGMNMMESKFNNTGYTDPETGEQWYTEQDRWEPGFSVGVLGALRLNKYMELRFSPGINFGQKHLKFHEQTSGRDTTQNMRCNYLSLPLELKLAAPRTGNFRPYFLVGVAPQIKLNDAVGDPIRDKRFDCMLEIGMGCDIYLRYFKLIPELKFCFGLRDIIVHDRSDLIDQTLMKYTNSLDRGRASMIVLSFYFE